jgi:hypothetical protein
LFTSKTFIVFLIPFVLLGMVIWFVATTDIDRGNVRVAGALVSPADVELSVTSSYLTEEGGARKLIVEMEGKNVGSVDVNLNPKNFQLVLANNENPNNPVAPRSVYNPMSHTSTCEEAPDSVSRIPPNAVRSLTVVFYGETLPSGDEWGGYLLSLEYYDPAASIMLSKLLKPTEE